MLFQSPNPNPNGAISFQPDYALHAPAIPGYYSLPIIPSIPLLGDQLVNTPDQFVPVEINSKMFIPISVTPVTNPSPVGQFEARHDDLSQTYADPAAPTANQK